MASVSSLGFQVQLSNEGFRQYFWLWEFKFQVRVWKQYSQLSRTAWVPCWWLRWFCLCYWPPTFWPKHTHTYICALLYNRQFLLTIILIIRRRILHKRSFRYPWQISWAEPSSGHPSLFPPRCDWQAKTKKEKSKSYSCHQRPWVLWFYLLINE